MDYDKQDPVELYKSGEITKQKMFNIQDEEVAYFIFKWSIAFIVAFVLIALYYIVK